MTDLFPEPASEVTSAPQPAAASEPATASDRKGLKIALILAMLAVVALGAMSIYLWTVHSEYVAQNEQLRETAEEIGTDLATSRATAQELQDQLAQTKDQLDEAKATINDLANSEAQAGDDRQALIDLANGLQDCADARQDLIDHLKEAYRWTPESLRASERSIDDYCGKVAKSYRELIDD